MVHCILLFTLGIVFPPHMSLSEQTCHFLDPNQPRESKRDRGSFRNDFTWKDACCLNMPFCFTVLVISPHTLWKHLRMVNSFCTQQQSQDGLSQSCPIELEQETYVHSTISQLAARTKHSNSILLPERDTGSLFCVAQGSGVQCYWNLLFKLLLQYACSNQSSIC